MTTETSVDQCEYQRSPQISHFVDMLQSINMIVLSTFIALFLATISPSIFAGPMQYKDVDEVMRDHGDYDAESGMYRKLSESPLHIQLAPRIFDFDSTDNRREAVERALMYGVFRTFLHTDANEVTVTSMPMLITMSDDDSVLKEDERITLSFTRSEIESLVTKHLGYSSLRPLVEDQEFDDGFVVEDVWSEEFNKIYYNDLTPGRDAFFEDLVRVGH